MSNITINENTTLAALVDLGLIKPEQIKTWERRANKKAVDTKVRAKTKVAAHRAVSRSLKALVECGALVNNKDTISNNCHMRHWIPAAE